MLTFFGWLYKVFAVTIIFFICVLTRGTLYFLDFDEDVLLEEFWTKYSKEEVITMIWDVIKNKETAEKNGLSEEEQGYYEGLLKSN